ncbi:hypothetical protein HPP92_008641 [Vanilla planifolia]|uniref:UBA domain-containing protein n=1 Tax=Vanilla planifolia TaxID=51239 RepID=A0A835RE38_VANPL|nr:hypothetical protein HPP92_008641 [Vanilla planifolia]
MDYDYRNRTAAPYRPAGGGASMYPRVGGAAAPAVGRLISPASLNTHPAEGSEVCHKNPYPMQAVLPPPEPLSVSTDNRRRRLQAGLGIRVAIKPEYRLNPPPQLAPQMAEIARCTFQFDFDFERRILAEAEKGSQNWSNIASESLPSKAASPTISVNSTGDPLVDKYVAEGLPREATSLGVLNYGDNPVKVREFIKGYNLLREMGFASKNVAEALGMYDNDTDKAIAHFLNSSS